MNQFGFDKTLRLLTPREFKAVFDGAKPKVSNQHILFLAKYSNNPYPRLGLVIAKKNVRLAVQRNRVKRAIRESFRLRQQQLAGLDIVVLARKGLGDLDPSSLHQMLEQLWLQLLHRASKKRQVQP